MNKIRALLDKPLVGAEPVAILGCGSSLRADDAVGTVIAETLAQHWGESNNKARAFVGHSAPENLTGAIKRFKPGLVFLIDAIDMGLAAGELQLISPEELGGVSFSTHMLPLPVLMDYLQRELGCEVLLLGVQVATLEFMAPMSPAVIAAVDAISTELLEIVQSS